MPVSEWLALAGVAAGAVLLGLVWYTGRSREDRSRSWRLSLAAGVALVVGFALNLALLAADAHALAAILSLITAVCVFITLALNYRRTGTYAC
jgi:FtsH-binding integral membrane protein